MPISSYATRRARLMMAVIAFIGLLVGIDGLLQGQWLRSAAGWAWFAAFLHVAVRGVPDFLFPRQWRERIAADLASAFAIRRSGPMILAGALFALLCFAGALALLLAPWEQLMDYSARTGYLLRSLEAVGGRWGARLALAALFAFAGGAAVYTAIARLRS